MRNFTSQAHYRNYQGNVVVENPGQIITRMRRKQRRRNLINGILIAGMILTVIFTGTLLGATTAHNHHLKTQLNTFETQKVAEPALDESAATEIQPDSTPVTAGASKTRRNPQDYISKKTHDVTPLPRLN